MVQFLSIIFCWISSIFVGFFKSSRFLRHPICVKTEVLCVNKLGVSAECQTTLT